MWRGFILGITALFVCAPLASAYVPAGALQKVSPRILRQRVERNAINAAAVRAGDSAEPLVRYINAKAGITFVHPASWNVFDTTTLRSYYDRGVLRQKQFLDIEIFKRTDEEETEDYTLNDVTILMDMDTRDPDDEALDDVQFESEELNEQGSTGPRNLFQSRDIIIDGHEGVRYSSAPGSGLHDTVTTTVRWEDAERDASYVITYAAPRHAVERYASAFDAFLESLRLGSISSAPPQAPAPQVDSPAGVSWTFIHQYRDYIKDEHDEALELYELKAAEYRVFIDQRLDELLDSTRARPFADALGMMYAVLQEARSDMALLEQLYRKAQAQPMTQSEYRQARAIRVRYQDLEQMAEDFFDAAGPSAYLAFDINHFVEHRKPFLRNSPADIDATLTSAEALRVRLLDISKGALVKKLTLRERDVLEELLDDATDARSQLWKF